MKVLTKKKNEFAHKRKMFWLSPQLASLSEIFPIFSMHLVAAGILSPPNMNYFAICFTFCRPDGKKKHYCDS